MRKKQKETLTDKDILSCDDFKEKRLRCNKSQQEWANAVGISLGLVKGIEGYTRRCTPKTEEKVKHYLAQLHATEDTPDTRSLEARILNDVFLSHMNKMGKTQAEFYAGPCISHVQEILSAADRFKTPNEQKLYFQYLSVSLWMLKTASSDFFCTTTDGQNVLEIAEKLYSDFVNKLAKIYKSAKETPAPENGTNIKQPSLFDTNNA